MSDRGKQLDELYRLQGGICYWCKRRIPRTEASRDHIIPRSLQGSDSIRNLILACQPCNIKRGNRDHEAWASENGRKAPKGGTITLMGTELSPSATKAILHPPRRRTK